jgi:hypothetical protein
MARRSIRSYVGILTLLVGVSIARPALAGPPLLCHPFDIGAARSLPWDGTNSWFHGRADYNVANLVADTEALLTPSTPIIVRMETLRRAAIYASGDRRVAEQLMTRLTNRAGASDTSGRPDALALLDAAYVIEAFRQISYLGDSAEFRGRASMVRALIGDADGYSLIGKSLALRPNDPALEFAAALIASDRHRNAYSEHARKAKAGASQDTLLARNIRQVS